MRGLVVSSNLPPLLLARSSLIFSQHITLCLAQAARDKAARNDETQRQVRMLQLQRNRIDEQLKAVRASTHAPMGQAGKRQGGAARTGAKQLPSVAALDASLAQIYLDSKEVDANMDEDEEDDNDDDDQDDECPDPPNAFAD